MIRNAVFKSRIYGSIPCEGSRQEIIFKSSSKAINEQGSFGE
jgi:hypothetical protein